MDTRHDYDVSKAAGILDSMYSAWEDGGAASPSNYDLIKAVAEAFELNLDHECLNWLADGLYDEQTHFSPTLREEASFIVGMLQAQRP